MKLSIYLLTLTLVIQGIFSEDDVDSNEIVSSPAPTDLDGNLRRALLRALNELENEGSEVVKYDNGTERVIEKAHASSLTIYANSEESATTPADDNVASSTIKNTIVTAEPEKDEKSYVILQNSEGIQEKTITSYEKEHTDIDGSNFEQILTSASNSFSHDDQAFAKSVQDEKSSTRNTNSIQSFEKSTLKPTTETTTATTTTSTTEESEAKVENVQFFSAPLVAAFTVHQDEQGLPKKVEPIFKQPISENNQQKFDDVLKFKQEEQKKEQQKIQEQIRLQEIRFEQARLEQSKQQLNQEELRRQQKKSQEQNELHQKQRALEQEILRLNFNLNQQQEFLLKQQEQLRLRNNAQPFLPIPNPNINQISNTQVQNIQQLPTIQQPVIQQLPVVQQLRFTQNFPVHQQLPVKPPQEFRNVFEPLKNAVSLQPSITFDPLVENGKLPINGQILPVKSAINFHSPLIQTPQFQQFHSLSPAATNFNQLSVQALPQRQSNRFFRQENGVGNFVNNPNSGSFSIQQSIHPPPLQNNIVRSPAISNEVTAFRNLFPQQSNRFFRSNPESSLQNNRYFRSNSEGTFAAPTNFYRHDNNNQLNNLLFNSGAIRARSPEDLSLFSKVLSLNHDNRYAASTRHEQRIPYYRNI